MMEHLGGAESPLEIARRHKRYLDSADPAQGVMFTITLAGESNVVGTVGYWKTTWKDERVYEAGWMVLPEFRACGIATAAATAVARCAAGQQRHRFLHAFPSIRNIASNVVCERAGFSNLGVCTYEYPQGHLMQCNDWRIALM